MLIAVAGSGNLAQYICEEFPKVGHRVRILSRSIKEHLRIEGCEQVVVDYSQPQLDDALQDCEVLISTIVDLSSAFIQVHLNLITACQRSQRCKRFIPSEFAGNVKDFPDQPMYFINTHSAIRKTLADQKEIEWTIVCIGFLADYIVPSRNRYVMDMREGNMIDYENKHFKITGTGHEPMDVTSARDVASGLASLVTIPNWEKYTYMSGERTSWWQIVGHVRRRDPEFTASAITLGQIGR
ncbi:hypothetical protein LTR84_005789 [Exophiala bonariae]|uniref:NmrA-like domain-containing protein n=1 Tax=Exophiala bonariae TaxID=1690606 RepID=A0AAV9N680_9EURO|nr:hypothetical protein LTR84_005789 [Exophiala bonariae]